MIVHDCSSDVLFALCQWICFLSLTRLTVRFSLRVPFYIRMNVSVWSVLVFSLSLRFVFSVSAILFSCVFLMLAELTHASLKLFLSSELAHAPTAHANRCHSHLLIAKSKEHSSLRQVNLKLLNTATWARVKTARCHCEAVTVKAILVRLHD